MEIKEIQDLIKFVAKSGVAEVELESKGFKIVIKTQHPELPAPAQQFIHSVAPAALPASAPAPAVQTAPAPATPAPSPSNVGDDSKYVTVKSPMIGTFYRRPSPDKDLFVNVGDEIKPGKVLCIIEAMKLFNEIEAEISGKIVKILADEASPVEYDQPLFLVDPS
jgi:acetyl-CoA carboxylase biotin carboxyl carrier protein